MLPRPSPLAPPHLSHWEHIPLLSPSHLTDRLRTARARRTVVGEMSQQSAPVIPSPSPAGASTGPDRFLLGIVAGVILLVLISIVIVLMTRTPRPAPPADPASIIGVVQGYVEATRAGDAEKARSYLTREARALSEERARQNPYSSTYDNNVRIIVEASSQTETTAEAKVTISRFYARSDPFSSNTSHRTVTVKLLREDGQWRITQPIEPYQFY